MVIVIGGARVDGRPLVTARRSRFMLEVRSRCDTCPAEGRTSNVTIAEARELANDEYGWTNVGSLDDCADCTVAFLRQRSTV